MKKWFYLLFLLVIIQNLVYPQKKSKKDIIISSQISESQLKTINAEEILDRCLNYPYLADIMFAQNIPLMFKHIRKEFNGFNELFLARKDGAQIILNRFLNFNLNRLVPGKFLLEIKITDINASKSVIQKRDIELYEGV
jgi:hypothetical protein